MSKISELNNDMIFPDYSNKKRRLDDNIFSFAAAIDISKNILNNIDENKLIEIHSKKELIDTNFYLIINNQTKNKIIGKYVKTMFQLSEVLFITKNYNMFIKVEEIAKDINFKIYSLSDGIVLAYLVSNLFD